MLRQVVASTFTSCMLSFLFFPNLGFAEKPKTEAGSKPQTKYQPQRYDFEEVIKKAGASQWVGQGNPKVTKHPVSREQCLSMLEEKNIRYENSQFEQICGAPYMAPLYDPTKEKPEDAKACIDQFEFPNIPCEYPVVWVRANEAAKICQEMGKRLCDAHEWEGGCDGALLEPDYPFDVQGANINETVRKWRSLHNKKYQASQKWAYGPKQKKGICGADSIKAPDCDGGNWQKCGSNTYPVGYFPECKSKLEVYDQHGNAAEHMNLPLKKEQMASAGSTSLGYTEMKGSWFIFDKYHAHPDWCRWRAPYWHGTQVMAKDSHHNYHLGFRCCKSLNEKPVKP
ncbi:MAG: SUMF1/EgtB/PvdO family nonheme iron enzyme [Oligoflexus sp.]